MSIYEEEPIDALCECEHNNPDSLDARLCHSVGQITPRSETVAHLRNQGCCVHIHTGNLSELDICRYK